jgi:hypothetical protein
MRRLTQGVLRILRLCSGLLRLYSGMLTLGSGRRIHPSTA